MSQVSINKIGAEVVKRLNCERFAKLFTAEYKLLPAVKLEDTRLRAYVIPQGRTTETEAKTFDNIARRLNIVLQKRVEDVEAEGQSLIELGEQLEDFIRMRENRSMQIDGINVLYEKIETLQLYVPNVLKNESEYLGGFTVTYFGLESTI